MASFTFELIQEIDFSYSFLITDTDKNPIDLTGATIISKIRPEVESTTILANMNTSNGGVSITGPGAFTIFLDGATTAGITGTNAIDILIELPTGEQYVIARNSKVKSFLIVSRGGI